MADWTAPTQDRVEGYFKALKNWGRCAEERRSEFLFTATPIRLVGSTGAPANPLAIF